jgi:hypothetical protein
LTDSKSLIYLNSISEIFANMLEIESIYTPTKGRYAMKGRFFAFVFIFCIAVLIVSGQEAQGKPDRPGEPDNPTAEWIEFQGPDLVTPEGGEVVYGCCPNAGPFPEYTMILGFEFAGIPANTPIDGWLYINYYGAGRDQKYKVQFWWDYDLDLGIEIIGGEIYHDRKNKVLTVTFTNDECVYIKSKTLIQLVNFTLVRRVY